MVKNYTSNNEIRIYADGSCLGNPGKGGWAALLQFFVHGVKRAEKMISGCSKETTNNKMELQALIEAFKALKKDKVKNYKIEIYLDSQYVLKSLTEWRESWEYRNFRGVKNSELMKELFNLYDIYNKNNDIKCHWVKGHSGHPENDKVDKEANNKAKQCS